MDIKKWYDTIGFEYLTLEEVKNKFREVMNKVEDDDEYRKRIEERGGYKVLDMMFDIMRELIDIKRVREEYNFGGEWQKDMVKSKELLLVRYKAWLEYLKSLENFTI